MEKKHADVGVIVARFQVHELHSEHRKVMDHVVSRHQKVLVFLGLSPVRVTFRNPLDFEARKQMVLEAYPDVTVLYIKDVVDDKIWSETLDSQIADIIGPRSTAEMYGSRESFADCYTGKWEVTVLQQEKFISGSEIRASISKATKDDPAFRAGVIWAAFNQYPRFYPTVDIAVWNEDCTQLLMARKKHETLYRFMGGFVQPGLGGEGGSDSKDNPYEAAAKREVREESGIEVADLTYLGSEIIDDWRYRNESDKIATMFFDCKYVFGKPEPADDITELRWLRVEQCDNMIVPEHVSLFDMLMDNCWRREDDSEIVKG